MSVFYLKINFLIKTIYKPTRVFFPSLTGEKLRNKINNFRAKFFIKYEILSQTKSCFIALHC